MAKQATAPARWWSAGVAGVGLFTLLLGASQLRCANAEGGWEGDASVNNPDGGRSDGGNPDGGEDVRCFTGTATTELQLLNHCTEAEKVERASSIPAKTWDGKSPLPYSS
ncbi:MAG: hypothetical protein QM769_03305 [Pseudoxanthomonas sp.]